MKKKILILLILIFITSDICFGEEYSFPPQFWNLTEGLEKAVKGKNYKKTVLYGINTVELMKNEPECREVTNVLADRYQKVGCAMAKLGHYDLSADAFEELITYAKKAGWDDSVKIAKAKILQYRTRLDLYTEGGGYTYLGARNEVKNGVLFGVCGNGKIREHLENESLILVYCEIGDRVGGYLEEMLEYADENKLAVEFALNCKNEAEDINNIRKKEKSLKEISALFDKYPTVPVLLRFGAEFDIWQRLTDGKSFIDAFRYVSEYFRTRNSNIAMVWSPNQVSNWNINIDDFYPGDRYVDWVGLSLYSMKYFLGDNTITDDFTEVCFKTGINSDPVLAMEELVLKYGYRKPFIISESGQTNFVYNRINENTENWAVRKMREFYSYIPMVYPCVKAAAYFDYYPEGETNDYRLSNSEKLKNTYIGLTKGKRFIQNSYDAENTFTYKKFENGSKVGKKLNLYAYTHIYDDEVRCVDYYVNGKFVSSSDMIPFKAELDLSKIRSGQHILKIVATTMNGKQKEKEYTFIL